MAQTITTTNTTTNTDWLLDRLLSNTMAEMSDSVTSMDPTDEIALAVAGDSWDALASLPPSPVVPATAGFNSSYFWDDPLCDLIEIKSSINGDAVTHNTGLVNMSINLNSNSSIVTKAPPNTPRPPTMNNDNPKFIKAEERMVVNPNIHDSAPHTRPGVANVTSNSKINTGGKHELNRPMTLATPPPTPTKYHVGTAAALYKVPANHRMIQPHVVRKTEPVALMPKLAVSHVPVRRIQPSNIIAGRTPTPSVAFATATTITTSNKKRSISASPNVSDNKGARRPKRYKSAAPSRFCHVCGRKAATTRVALCGRLIDGLCRKVVCERCINKYNWAKDAPVGKSTPDKNWSCPHCRGVCVPKASCSTYERINSKRKLLPRALTPETSNNNSAAWNVNNNRLNNQNNNQYNYTKNNCDNYINNNSSESSNSITSSTTVILPSKTSNTATSN